MMHKFTLQLSPRVRLGSYSGNAKAPLIHGLDIIMLNPPREVLYRLVKHLILGHEKLRRHNVKLNQNILIKIILFY